MNNSNNLLDLPSDTLSNVASFLSFNDRLTWRLISRQTNEMIESDDEYWETQWLTFKNSTLPKSFLFHNGILFDSNHIAIKNLSNNLTTVRRSLSQKHGLNLNSRSMDDLKQAIIKEKAPLVHDSIQHWITEPNSVRTNFSTIVSHLATLRSRWPSLEIAQINLQRSLVCFERTLLLELCSRFVINMLFIVAVLLIAFNVTDTYHTNWNIIFTIVYLYIALVYGIRISRQVHHVCLAKAGVHNKGSLILLGIINLILKPLSASLSLLGAVLFHLKALQVEPFKDSFLRSCIPLFVMIGVEWIIYLLDLLRLLKDFEGFNLEEIFKVYYTVDFLTVEAMLVLVCIKLDKLVPIAWSLWLSPVDAIFIMCGILFTVLLLSIYVKYEFPKSVTVWIIVEWLMVATLWLCAVLIHILLDTVYTKGYVILCLSVLHTIWEIRLWTHSCRLVSLEMVRRWFCCGATLLGRDELERTELIVF